jgi:DNA-directed RNA polymerase subunit RPC12/RpoP
VIDTLLIAKEVAKFTSNKLAWLSEYLTDTPKDEHNEFPGMALWTECLKGNKRAWAVMKKYNCIDVPATEKLYLRLRPYMIGHPNVAAYYTDDKVRCPRCASTKLVKLDKPAFTQSGQYTRYQCSDCGGFARSRYTENSKAKRLSLLAN